MYYAFNTHFFLVCFNVLIYSANMKSSNSLDVPVLWNIFLYSLLRIEETPVLLLFKRNAISVGENDILIKMQTCNSILEILLNSLSLSMKFG